MANKYFDTLREKTESEIMDAARFQPNRVISDAYEKNLSPMRFETPQDKENAISAGFQPTGNNPNEFQTPSRPMADYMENREQQRQKAWKSKYDETRDSVGFKVADSLADTGRLFLSPLLWLGGEDPTKYDPSAQLEAGYRKQFDASENFRAALYSKVAEGREIRSKAMQERNNYLTEQKQTTTQQTRDNAIPQSAAGKVVYDFAVQRDRMSEFGSRNPETVQRLTWDARVAAGDGLYVGKDQRFMEKATYADLSAIGQKMGSVSADIGAAYSNYNGLIKALNDETGIGDVSAIFNFMKTLDPDSVVRESEFALAENAAGLFASIENKYAKMKEGTGLTPKAREDMAALALQLIEGYEDSYERARSKYEGDIRYRSDNQEDVDTFLGAYKYLGSEPTIERP